METTNANVPQAAPAAPSPAVNYAGFWLRLVAFLIDAVVLGIASWILAGIFGYEASSIADNQRMNGLNWVVGLLYYTLLESSSYQGTLGKQAMGLKVTDLNGARISWPKALGRYVAKILSAVILMIGFIMAGFTEKKQALHDILAGTLVVKK